MMNSFINYLCIVVSYQIYLKVKYSVQEKISVSAVDYPSLLINTIFPSFAKNPFFYCLLVVRLNLFICRNFLHRLEEYRATLYRFTRQTGFNTLIQEQSILGFNFSDLHFLPRLEKRDFKMLNNNPELDARQLERDLKYIIQVEATVNWLENCEKLILWLMVIFWIGKAGLLNYRILFS
jgi:hypothetical protein